MYSQPAIPKAQPRTAINHGRIVRRAMESTQRMSHGVGDQQMQNRPIPSIVARQRKRRSKRRRESEEQCKQRIVSLHCRLGDGVNSLDILMVLTASLFDTSLLIK